MKVIIAVIVHDRFYNIEEWVRCWKQCDRKDAELVIIHNFRTEEDIPQYRSFCEQNEIKYISRPNIGMDIGAFQDVCRGRLEGFPNEWDYLLWCTDDLLIMSKDFVSLYVNEMATSGGVVCLEMSYEYKLHIRTTGFMLDQLTASLIEFETDPILSKEDCYHFEHRWTNAFFEQVRRMDKNVCQVNTYTSKAPLWDMGNREHFNRWAEFNNVFPK